MPDDFYNSFISEKKYIITNYGQDVEPEMTNDVLEQKYLINDDITTSIRFGIKSFGIKKVIFNNPATIIIWNDGTKTISKISGNDIYSKEYGFMLCILKHILGPKTKRFIKHYCAENTSNIMKGGEAK